MKALTLENFGVKAQAGVEHFLTIPVDGNEVFGEKVSLVEEIGEFLVMPLDSFIAFANENLNEDIKRAIGSILVRATAREGITDKSVPIVSSKITAAFGSKGVIVEEFDESRMPTAISGTAS